MAEQIEACSKCVDPFECNVRFGAAALAIKDIAEGLDEATDGVLSGSPTSDSLNPDYMFHHLLSSIQQAQFHADERMEEIGSQLVADQLGEGCSYYLPQIRKQLRSLMS